MTVTMTMDEYQSLVNGTQIRSEADLKQQKAHDIEYEKGQRAIEMLYKLENALRKKSLNIVHNGYDLKIV